MNKLANRIHDESNGLDYVLVDDYYLPDIQLGNEEQRPIGRWGRLHREYLKEYRSTVYQDILVSGNLWSYLADLNEQAEERLERIIQQMKEAEGVTEQLKSDNQMLWVWIMNNIRNRAEEIVLKELIYTVE
jgi:hypothetical protein